MKAIIAVNKEGYIGLNGGLPWKCKADLQHFKKLTMGGTLLVGYRTAQSLPNLPGRKLVIDERDRILDIEKEGIDWCIGGKATYEKYAHLFTELHISLIHDDTVGDVKYPHISSNLNPKCKTYEYEFNTDN